MISESWTRVFANDIVKRGVCVAALILSLFSASCATIAPVDGTDRSRATVPQIIGAHGPLSDKQVKAVLARVGVLPKGTDTLQRYMLVDEMVTESPLIAGNSTMILRNGQETFEAMFKAISGAKNHINLEYFIFEDVGVDGRKLGDLLVSKQAEGVAVNVIYDSFGSDTTPSEFFDRLASAGIAVTQFNPINPLEARKAYALNHRDHRKILVVDGGVAIVGGVNLSSAYQSAPFGKSGAPADEENMFWRDTDLEIIGPAVRDLQKAYLEHWSDQKGIEINKADFFPSIKSEGVELVRIVRSTPDDPQPRYYVSVLSAIQAAEKNIWLDAAYFVPTQQEKESLMDAARRGVDVRLLLPEKSDSERSLAVQHSHYSDLLEANVKIYEAHNIVLHSKAIVIDGVWSTIGSSNFDYRSVIYNDEIDAVVIGSKTGKMLETMFEDDIKNARQITLKAWGERPLFDMLDEYFSRIVEIFL